MQDLQKKRLSLNKKAVAKLKSSMQKIADTTGQVPTNTLDTSTKPFCYALN